MMQVTRRIRHRYWIGTLLIGVVLVVAWGSDRTATPPAQGTAILGQLAAKETGEATFRVATFNIHGGKGADDRRDLERVADTLESFDLIALQEVHGPSYPGATDQAEALAESLDMAWLFAPTEYRWWSDSFGNALLTRLPVEQWKRIPLQGTQGKAFRNAVVTQVTLGHATLNVLITHVDRRDDREAQLAEVIEMYRSLPSPCILMGDLNTDRSDLQWAELLQDTQVVDVLHIGNPSTDNPSRIDWIISRGLQVVAAGSINNGASDHPCYWAELRLPGVRLTSPPPTDLPIQ